MARPLLEKMGWKPGMHACTAGLGPLLESLFAGLVSGPAATWCLGYCASPQDVRQRCEDLIPHYPDGGHLWLIYPKKSGRIAAPISRDHGWEALTAAGFLPVTQVAVDADHSALRFRRRPEIAVLTRKF